jgi:hypothetical protein
VKLKYICTANEIVTNLKRHSMEWEKIFDIDQKGVITKIYRKPKKLTSHQKSSDQIINGQLN